MEQNKIQSYRQGDVLIVKVDGLPEGLRPVKPDKKRNVLAYGEITGHSHSLCIKDSKLEETALGERFLSVPESASLTHEEHDTIVLPKGNYRIIQQVEYQREFRPVVD